jgi:hypothetical protein
LRDSVERITAENTIGSPVAPPRIASLSPFHEILARDVAASLPRELGVLISATTSLEELMDWVAGGAILRWIDDAYSRKVYLEELQRDPRRASLSLARAVASRMEPPPKPLEWWRRDLAGLILQLLVALGILLCRGFLVATLGFWISGQPVSRDWSVLITAALADLPVFLNPAAPGPTLAFVLLVVGAWHALEVLGAPQWMERARQLPLRMRNLPASIPWRIDTFQAAWLLQAIALWLTAGAFFARQAFTRSILVHDWTAYLADVIFIGMYLLTAKKVGLRLAKVSDNTFAGAKDR